MKRMLLFALLALLILSMSAFAAEAGKKMPMAFGVKAGLSLGNISGDSLTSGTGTTKSTKTGFLFGAVYSIEPVKGLAIQPELFYVQKGVKLTEGGATGKIKVDYLEVPVLVKWVPEIKASKIAPTIFVGPFLGLRMSSKLETPLGTEDMKDSTKSTDFGITFGGGLGYKLAKGQLFIDGRYDLGMTKLRKAGADGYQDDTKSATIMVAVGYKFDI